MRGSLTHGPPVISVDVEDWPQSTWDRSLPITERAADNTRRLLDMLDRSGVKVTMFVLGKFADAYPMLVRQIDEAGHEVGSHGYGHVEIFQQSREEFATDIRRAKSDLEDILGHPVRGYRAPDFSVVRRTLWALDVIAETGFEYDSSIFPVSRPRYGIPDWPLSPVRVSVAGGRTLVEVPIAAVPLLGRNWPVGGGGYHRLLPGVLIRGLARRVMRSHPFVFYCHPYEFDVEEFQRLSVPIPWKVRLHQGLGRSRFEKRFVGLVEAFGGRSVWELVQSGTWPRLDLGAFPASPAARACPQPE